MTKPLTLGLWAPQADACSPEFARIVDRLLDLFLRVIEPVASGSADRGLAATLRERRDALLQAQDAGQLAATGQSLIDACRIGAERLERQRADSRAEMASLLALLQEAVVTIAATGSGLSQDVTSSVARFEALHRITDIGQLKDRLAAEVRQLREMVAEREKGWSATVKTLEQRVTALEQQLADTLEVASHDPLTGCANRRVLDAALTAACTPGHVATVLALFDIDNFKTINDTKGHTAGDAVLVAVARWLTSAVREDDVVVRLGGDEFALVMQGTTLPKAEPRIRTMLKHLAEQPIVPESPDMRVTLSCGIVEYSAGDTPATLLGRADQALYDAKRGAKGRAVSKITPTIRDLLRKQAFATHRPTPSRRSG